MQKKRYYFHGDLKESDSDERVYFCAFCDSFEKDFMDHANHGSDYDRFDRDVKNGFNKKYYFRPINAFNIL